MLERTWIRRLIKVIKGLFFSALAAGIFLFAVFLWILWPVAEVPGAKADVIVILGESLSRGKPLPGYLARLRHGLVLYQEGRAPKILVCGGRAWGNTLS